MSEKKHERNCLKSQAYGTGCSCGAEPVASPQATRPQHAATCKSMSDAPTPGCNCGATCTNCGHLLPCKCDEVQWANTGTADYNGVGVKVTVPSEPIAAQPAAGTTPHDHYCMSTAQGHSICECKCGLLKPAAAPWPSEGTTPQAERPRCAVCGFPLAKTRDKGCRPGDCSMRPLPDRAFDAARANREYANFWGTQWSRRWDEPTVAEARAVAPVETTDAELCQNCHRENPVWFAPNAVWNAVVTEVSGILCPICFINRAEQQGFRCTGWELVPELVNRPTDDKTPVGVGAPANLAPVETRLTAEQFTRAILKPDPNEPDEDTFILHFPHAVEAVECREFWLKHLPELLNEFAEAFRDKSEAGLLERFTEVYEFSKKQAVEIGRVHVDATGLREEIERLNAELEKMK